MNGITIQKSITVIGVGGHGSNAYIKLLTDYPDYAINLIIGSDDSGGHTGFLQKKLQTMYPNLSPANFLPVGDLRGNIARLVYFARGQNGDSEMLAQLMNKRLKYQDNLSEFLEECNDFCLQFKLDDECDSFLEFCKNYIKTLTPYESEIKHSLGNLFLTYLMIEKHHLNLDSFFAELRQLKLIPKNVNIQYFSTERLVLEGGYEIRTKKGTEVITYVGEHEVDEATNELDPDKYILKDLNNNIITECEPVIADLIKNSEIIVLSCGSLANLLGQLNVLYKELDDNLEAFVVLIGNIFKGINEVSIEKLVDNIFGLGIEHTILTLDEENFKAVNGYEGLADKYANEGKSLQNIRNLKASLANHSKRNTARVNFLPILSTLENRERRLSRLSRLGLSQAEHTELMNMIGNVGIKHESRELSLLLTFMCELSYFLKNELSLKKESRMRIFYEITSRFDTKDKSEGRFYQEIQLLKEILIYKNVSAEQRLNVINDISSKFVKLTDRNITEFFHQLEMEKLQLSIK